jgi:hypothetical protein
MSRQVRAGHLKAETALCAEDGHLLGVVRVVRQPRPRQLELAPVSQVGHAVQAGRFRRGPIQTEGPRAGRLETRGQGDPQGSQQGQLVRDGGKE